MKSAVEEVQTAAAVDFVWPRITIGSNLDALRFAIKNKTFLLLNDRPAIHSYDLGPNGRSLEDDWASCSIELFNLGLHPFGSRIKSIRVDTFQKTIRVHAGSSKYEILYEDINVFGLQNVTGLEDEYTEELLGYRVLDWFDIKKGANISLDQLEDEGCFVKRIQLFTSTRRDGDHASKDLVSESLLTYEQLNSVDYSDTISKFKTIKMLSSAGYGGVELELWKRDVMPVFSLKRLS